MFKPIFKSVAYKTQPYPVEGSDFFKFSQVFQGHTFINSFTKRPYCKFEVYWSNPKLAMEMAREQKLHEQYELQDSDGWRMGMTASEYRFQEAQASA